MLAVAQEFLPRIRRNEPMSRHTSWHVGGPAEIYFTPSDRADLAAFLRSVPAEVPVCWVGLGSNLLVRDGGIAGVVISMHGTLDRLERAGPGLVYGEAGVACARIARQCIKWGLGPAEFFAGIPGTLGGALAMNAGAFGGETWRQVVEVETIDRGGHEHRRLAGEYRVSYRHVEPPVAEEWFLAARLRFEERATAPGDFEPVDIQELLERRKATQPIGEWSCGSVFTNPPGDHAARLIEAAGLKGLRVGGASVSVKHANFIINHGGATAADIESLIGRVQDEVQRTHGVRLHPEVRIVGRAAGGTVGQDGGGRH
jgi:UDP-N-acetylmuramate dehydrogenase